MTVRRCDEALNLGAACDDTRSIPLWCRRWQTLEEVFDWGRKRLRNSVKATGANSVLAFFVLLDLLKGQAQGSAELFLADAQCHPAKPYPASDVCVDVICAFQSGYSLIVARTADTHTRVQAAH